MLPVVSEDTIYGFLGTVQDEIILTPDKDHKMIKLKWDQMMRENPELASFISSMIQSIFNQDATCKTAFYIGAVFTYELLRRQDESDNL